MYHLSDALSAGNLFGKVHQFFPFQVPQKTVGGNTQLMEGDHPGALFRRIGGKCFHPGEVVGFVSVPGLELSGSNPDILHWLLSVPVMMKFR
jgi:hypothetical protein